MFFSTPTLCHILRDCMGDPNAPLFVAFIPVAVSSLCLWWLRLHTLSASFINTVCTLGRPVAAGYCTDLCTQCTIPPHGWLRALSLYQALFAHKHFLHSTVCISDHHYSLEGGFTASVCSVKGMISRLRTTWKCLPHHADIINFTKLPEASIPRNVLLNHFTTAPCAQQCNSFGVGSSQASVGRWLPHGSGSPWIDECGCL